MEKRSFGRTELKVSPLGFGAAEIGFQDVDVQTVEKLLTSALEAGLNVIDTAECYKDSEELIGKAVSHRRSQYYLFSKCGHGGGYLIDAWQPQEIEKTIDRSLRLMKTDYLDLVQLHSCSEALLRKGDVIEALQKAKKAGKTRWIGYSGDGLDALYAINCDAFDTLQTSVSIADQEAIDLTIPLAVEKGMGVIAKRPIANAAWRNQTKPDDNYVLPYWERLKKLAYDFTNGDEKAAVEMALRFTLTVPGVHIAIVGTTRPGRWEENAGYASKGALNPSAYEAIRTRWKQESSPQWIGQI
jgi:aryl-alcohol dehydrogenase-like predicted oxidoreductase